MLPNKCPRCGCKEQYSKHEEYIGYNICEYDITCKFCDFTYDYYAYGNFESENPQKPTLCWHNIKISIKLFLQSIYYHIKRKIINKSTTINNNIKI